MSQKAKVLVSVLVVVVLLTIGGTATVMAQGKPVLTPEVNGKGFLASMVGPQIELGKSFGSVGDNTTAGLLARVATILGIDQQKLEDAFAQAQSEMRDEALGKRLQKLVDEGKITQEQADQCNEWWQQRPEIMAKGLFPRACGNLGLGGGPMGGWRGGHMSGWPKG